MFCPECGTRNSDNSKFCKECGEDFSGKNLSQNLQFICPFCAEQINKNAVKCKHCGEWLNKKVEREIKQEDNSSVITLGYVFSILGGLIGLFFSIYLLTRNNKNANKHGMIMLLLFFFWVTIISSFYYAFTLVLISNILIGLTFTIYILKKGENIPQYGIIIVSALLILALFSSIEAILQPFIPYFFISPIATLLTYFIIFLDLLIILSIYLISR